jgi:hypothetical protein
MSRFPLKSQNRWVILTLVFGVGPIAAYLAFINPSIERVAKCREVIALQASGASLLDFGPSPASGQEEEQLQEIRTDQLSRVKKIQSRESLLRFSGTLADALAFQARSFGLRVLSVNLQNPLISGSYVPAHDHALDTLAELASPEWDELLDPLDLPMLRLPSIEIDIAIAAEYSQVFSYIESLPDFPALVQLTGLQTMDEASGKAYRLKIRGYYCGNENIKQTVQSEMQSAENAF